MYMRNAGFDKNKSGTPNRLNETWCDEIMGINSGSYNLAEFMEIVYQHFRMNDVPKEKCHSVD